MASRDLVVGLVWSPELETGRAGHAVAERAHLLARHVHVAHAEELQLLDGPPLTFSITCHAFGPWIWKRQHLRVTALP